MRTARFLVTYIALSGSCLSVFFSWEDLINSGPSSPTVVCRRCQTLLSATSDRRSGSCRIRKSSCQHWCVNETRNGKVSVFYCSLRETVRQSSYRSLCFPAPNASLKCCSCRRVRFDVCLPFLQYVLLTFYCVQHPEATLTNECREKMGLKPGRSWASLFKYLEAPFFLSSMGVHLS